MLLFFFFQAEDGIRDLYVTGVQTCALPICLGLETLVHVELGLRTGDEDRRQPAQDDAHDRHGCEELHDRVPALPSAAPQLPPTYPDHRDLASTSASALRAASSLLRPMPQAAWAWRSAAISRRRASAPCHQPNLAPVTIQDCWYRKWLTFAEVWCGWSRSQASSRRARSVSGI